MHVISNDLLSINIDPKGAELQSIRHRQNNIEYLWSGDEKYWAKHSPVLFPIVGNLKNNAYNYKGKEYKLSRHGFARDIDFELPDKSENAATFSLRSSEETKVIYPFDFLFKVKYTLEQNKLHVQFTVENTGTDEMYFSVGAHPAFAVPLDKTLAYEDYYLSFNEIETINRWPISIDGLIEKNSQPFLENAAKLSLKKDLFYNDAIVVKHLRSDSISILSDHSPHGIKVSFDGFPYLGIWAAKDADFVCIEPWCGIADSVTATGELPDKEGIINLPAGKDFVKSYSIEFL